MSFYEYLQLQPVEEDANSELNAFMVDETLDLSNEENEQGLLALWEQDEHQV